LLSVRLIGVGGAVVGTLSSIDTWPLSAEKRSSGASSEVGSSEKRKQVAHLLHRAPTAAADVLDPHRPLAAAVAVGGRLQRPPRLQHLVELAHDVHRQPHRGAPGA
jgi:hypothetical protein